MLVSVKPLLEHSRLELYSMPAGDYLSSLCQVRVLPEELARRLEWSTDDAAAGWLWGWMCVNEIVHHSETRYTEPKQYRTNWVKVWRTGEARWFAKIISRFSMATTGARGRTYAESICKCCVLLAYDHQQMVMDYLFNEHKTLEQSVAAESKRISEGRNQAMAPHGRKRWTVDKTVADKAMSKIREKFGIEAPE